MVVSALTENTLSVGSVHVNNRWPSTLDWIAVALLAGLALWLFRGHVFGDTLWIGNPDRLNGDLKYLGHYLSGLEGGKIAAWNEHEMMGYDSLAMAGTSPNPLVYLVSLFGHNNLYVSMGYVFVGLMIASGAAAYSFLRAFLPAGAAALVGAICYEFSALAILKNSQNSMTFAVLILIPLFMLVIRQIRRESAAWCFVALALLLICMLNYMFLQKAAYALMLIGAYATWRSYSEKSWWPALIFGLAVVVAMGFSFPRILSVGSALSEYKRSIEGLDLKNFDVLYSFQNIQSYEILRWLDNSLFGLTPSDSHDIGNNINLTEGFLLYTSSIVPLLLLTGLVRDRLTWLNPLRSPNGEAGFFFWILIICIAVIVVKPVAHLMFLLFMSLDFTHARIQISALLPLSLLVALSLSRLAPSVDAGHKTLKQTVAGIAIGVFVAVTIETVAQRFTGTTSFAHLSNQIIQEPNLRIEALARILLSAIFFLLILRRVFAESGRFRSGAYAALCALLVSQCLLAANQQVNGPLTLNFVRPFHWGDYYHARRDEFTPPSAEQLRILHERIEPQRYRVALVCDAQIADGFCAGHVPEFWQLRSIDGYYGPGVPRRIRALPWPAGVSLRTISFTNIESVPWALLGALNVRSVLVASDGVFRNIVRDNDRITGRPDPATFEILPSPARVTPRAFFATSVQPAASPEDAAKQMFQPEGVIDPLQTSFVEGINQPQNFGNGSAVELQGENDTLELHFTASTSERFLVLNELYYPGWRAMSEGRELPILPTNAVMRGVIVPAGATTVQFSYVSYLDSTSAWAFRISAVLAILALFIAMRRRTKA
jgi:hypothetical protein